MSRYCPNYAAMILNMDLSQSSKAKNMFHYLKAFVSQDDGAVTVDWVVLTAATVGLGFLVLAAVNGSVVDKTKVITDTIVADLPS